MKTIPLTRGKFALVDDEDYEVLNQSKWCLDSNGYAARCIWEDQKRKRIYMHRVVVKAPKGMFTDHINGDRTDNQKANLRIVTHHQNNFNRRKFPRWTSRYKGVMHKSKSARGKLWVSSIKFKKKTRRIGAFDIEHHAALAYDLWAKHLYGKLARTNFQVVSNN